jgi:hypothetical protein
MNVLVVNSGSSSLKFQVIATDLERIRQDKDDRICRGEVEGIGGEAIIRFKYRNQPPQTLTQPFARYGSRAPIPRSLYRFRSVRSPRNYEYGRHKCGRASSGPRR